MQQIVSVIALPHHIIIIPHVLPDVHKIFRDLVLVHQPDPVSTWKFLRKTSNIVVSLLEGEEFGPSPKRSMLYMIGNLPQLSRKFEVSLDLLDFIKDLSKATQILFPHLLNYYVRIHPLFGVTISSNCASCNPYSINPSNQTTHIHLHLACFTDFTCIIYRMGEDRMGEDLMTFEFGMYSMFLKEL